MALEVNDKNFEQEVVKADKPAMIKEEEIRDFIKEKLPKHQEVMLGKILLWMLQE